MKTMRAKDLRTVAKDQAELSQLTEADAEGGLFSIFEGWSYPLVVAHYRVYGDTESWDVYGEKHIVIDAGLLSPDFRDIYLIPVDDA